MFPLGLYTVCMFRVAQAIDAAFPLTIPRAFVYVALAAWTAAVVGLGRALVRP